MGFEPMQNGWLSTVKSLVFIEKTVLSARGVIDTHHKGLILHFLFRRWRTPSLQWVHFASPNRWSLHYTDWADYSVPTMRCNFNKYKVYIIFFLFCKIASKDFFIFYFFIDLLIGLNNLLINFYYYLFLWCSTITPVKIVGAMYEYTSRHHRQRVLYSLAHTTDT